MVEQPPAPVTPLRTYREHMSRLCLKSLVLLWAGSIVVGLTIMLNYEFTPARSIDASSNWPRDSQLQPGQNCPTLLTFIHPRCPCSRASLVELRKLISKCKSPLALRIVFIRPAEFKEGWQRTHLYSLAESIPGAIVITDPAAIEAGRFKVTTSGETLLYTAEGNLVFQGGLTASRGHEGQSVGQDALEKLIGANDATPCRASVFGCALCKDSPAGKGSKIP